MRRSFKGKLCAYCAESTCESDDHVFALEFFSEEDRDNTPKVPSCKRCNNELKGVLEKYATCVLPFSSRHPNAAETIEKRMPRRLQKDLATRRALLEGRERALIEEPNGLLLPTETFKVDSEKIAEWMRYVVQGLVYYHWGIYLKRDETDIGIRMVRVEGDPLLRDIFDQISQGNAHVQKDFGNGTVRYEGIKISDQPILSTWRIQLLDGIYMVDDGRAEAFWITTTGKKVPGASNDRHGSPSLQSPPIHADTMCDMALV